MVDIHPISLLLFSATLPLKLAKNGGKFNLKDVTFIKRVDIYIYIYIVQEIVDVYPISLWLQPSYQNLKNNNNNNNIAYTFNALKPKRLNQLAPC